MPSLRIASHTISPSHVQHRGLALLLVRAEGEKGELVWHLDVYKDENDYKSIYDKGWMIKHVQKNLSELRVKVKITFCLDCTCEIKDKAEIKPDVKKISIAVEESTKDCLGNPTIIMPNEATLTQWKDRV
ncbi:hypothetical protein TMatcc_001217 [Talaromyces marneffei ATCC 18224]